MNRSQTTNLAFVVVAILLTIELFPTCAGENDTASSHACPTSFQFLFQVYRSCCMANDAGRSGSALTARSSQVTGADVIAEMQRLCSRRTNITACGATSLARCSTQLRGLFRSAVDKAFWFCDADNNVRGVMTNALISTPPPEIPETERERDSRRCQSFRPADNRASCPQTVLGSARFSRIRNYGDLIRHDASQVLSDPLALQYFRELFDCYASKLSSACGHNTIPMVLASQNHLLFPPKFGINISDIILTRSAQINGRESRG